FARHPRTKARMEQFRIKLPKSIKVTEPLSYLEAVNLLMDAKVVLTDSGGLQEESTALGVPCITLRDNTERPITITEGTNVLVGSDPQRIRTAFEEVMAGHSKAGRVPDLWDGHASERIVAAIDGWLEKAAEE
ncbi:MAG: UDP-N-acetylglucosamine 2-epimerase, partial [Planctomycetes bacterium]|nr:UDP-N-acetylglucosamine 2-epimerase [Planctomycetota bacterium]